VGCPFLLFIENKMPKKLTLQNDNAIQSTKNWLRNFVIEYSICPFAKREFENGRIHYEVIQTQNLQQQLEAVLMQCIALDNNENIETSLLIFPQGVDDFDDYLDLLAISNELLEKQGFEDNYQIASFHPDYCFAGVDKNDASNYTNRSPYPMLHILRESSVEKAIANYPNSEEIPNRNIKLTREVGIKSLQKLLAACQ